ncbi:MAG: hypothetical protein QXI12_09090 [Candidatus Methanomethyliaceae archaeon]
MSERKKTLKEIFLEHEGKVSDKWSLYIAEYERVFQEYRDRPIKLLEIGVQNGGSLEIWSKYFENGLLFLGCDIDSACAALRFDDPRIVLIIGDANTDSTREQILSHSPEFDIVIDDGSHHSKDIIRSFLMYFPIVANNGGVYIVEDLHTSYWKEFGGGLFNPFSAVSFFKRLVDIINSEHWGIERMPSEILTGFQETYGIVINNEILQYIHSIEFVNSLCIVRKSRPINNKLGPRIVTGKNADVCPSIVNFHDTFLVSPPQTSNLWSIRFRPPDEEIIEREQVVQQLQIQLTEKEQAIAQLQMEQERLAQQLAEKEQVTQQLQIQLAEKEQAVAQLQARLQTEKERLVQQLAEKEYVLQQLSVRLAEKEQMLQKMQQKLSCKLYRYADMIARLFRFQPGRM